MKFSTSINIERDFGKSLNYVVTANAKQAMGKIINSYNTGIHSFCLVGSYGTGKSSFLLEFENCLTNETIKEVALIKNKGQFNSFTKFRFINIVGDYASLLDLIFEHVQSTITNNDKNFFRIIEDLYKETQERNEFLVFVIDEFGKVLEHAAKNNPEKEMYLLQKFCEYINDTNKNILLITTLHQSFNAYSKALSTEQKQEWTKVKGRIQDIIFKEPIEQLLSLTATKISATREAEYSSSIQELYKLSLNSKFLNSNLDKIVVSCLYPMDVFSAYILTEANQRYGQNERTLFMFLEERGENSISNFKAEERSLYNIARVYDYIEYNFNSFLSEANQDLAKWSAIKVSIERIEGLNFPNKEIKEAIDIVKVIGLLNIFASSTVKIDSPFLSIYAHFAMKIDDIRPTIKELEKYKIIRYAKYKSKYILYEGTDVDLEMGLYNAAIECKRSEDFIDKLKSIFDTKISIDNAHYYRTGTPRYYQYRISNNPLSKILESEIDGYIDLLFVRDKDIDSVKSQCLNQLNIPVSYCIFRNTESIIDHIFEIDKLKWVLDYYITDENDKIAIKEISNLIEYEKSIINKIVIDSIYSKNVEWIFNGLVLKPINNRKDLSKLLSMISETIYYNTPIFKNELINRYKPSSTMSYARQNYMTALLENSEKEDLGFEKEKFPPEKSIYLTLLKNTGIHYQDGLLYTFTEPSEESFKILWDVCNDFLKSAKDRQRKLTDLSKLLSLPPYGMKQGFIDCWLPTFILIRKDDIALYSNDTYVPYITKEVLELLQRNLNSFYIRSFYVEGIKLQFFEKYREAINLKSTSINKDSFIETIRPFLTFYKHLNAYAKTTKEISTTAIKFREIIANATDPEVTFFESLPEALGFKEIIISQNPEAIGSFVTVLQDSIRSLRTCYDDFLKSIEKYILNIFKISKTDYIDYKPIIDNRYKSIIIDLMPYDVKNFHSRLVGKFVDRKTWIESVCYVVLNKPLENIKDSEKTFLLISLRDKIFQLDDYVEMHKSNDESIIRLHITQNKGNSLTKQVIIPNESLEEVNILQNKIESVFSSNDSLNMAALFQIIKNKLQ